MARSWNQEGRGCFPRCSAMRARNLRAPVHGASRTRLTGLSPAKRVLGNYGDLCLLDSRFSSSHKYLSRDKSWLAPLPVEWIDSQRACQGRGCREGCCKGRQPLLWLKCALRISKGKTLRMVVQLMHTCSNQPSMHHTCPMRSSLARTEAEAMPMKAQAPHWTEMHGRPAGAH